MQSRPTIDDLRAQISAIESGFSNTRKPDSLEPGHHGRSFKNDDGLSSHSCNQPKQITTSKESRETVVESDSAFQKILLLLNASDKPEKVLRERLIQSGFTQDAIDSAVSRAKDFGFIDDMRYAEVLIRSRLAQGKGSAGIERELSNCNIDIFLVEGWPHSFGVDESSELDRALDLLERKPPRSKNPRESAYRKLASKGYASAIASKAARIWYENKRGFE